jgi:anti-sigma factor RsiW
MDGSPWAPSLVNASDGYAHWDAAYVLGSLTDADRIDYEAHLRDCPSCRRTVDELRDMPAILGQLTPDEFAAVDDGASDAPPLNPQVLTSLVATVRRRRRNAQLVTWGAALAAAAAVVVGVLYGVQLHWGETSSVQARSDVSPVEMTRVAPTELTATVAMSSHGWGTQIDMNCIYPNELNTSAADEAADKLAMVVVARDGSHDQLATWIAVKGVHATPAGSTARPIDQIATVEIVAADTGNVLLQRTL